MVGEVKAPDEGGRFVYIPIYQGGIAAVLAIDRLGLWADPAPIPPWEWRKLQKRAARCYLVVAYVNSARSVHLLVLGSLHNSQICANGCEGGM